MRPGLGHRRRPARSDRAEWLIGIALFVKSQIARWLGVAILTVNAIAQLLMMPAYPFWSLCIFTLNVLAVYGLIAHGHRSADSRGGRRLSRSARRRAASRDRSRRPAHRR